AELFKICGLKVSQSVALAEFCGLPSVDKEHVQAALSSDHGTPDQRRALEIKQIIGGTSVTKLRALIRMVGSDGRMRAMYVFCGAHTWRFTGRGPQPQNLPAGGPKVVRCRCGRWCPDTHKECPRCGRYWDDDNLRSEWGIEGMEQAISDVNTLPLAELSRIWGSVVNTIGSCLRGMFIAAPGMELISSDYSSIEAVVLAVITGCNWRIRVFQTHGKIYEASAAQMFNMPVAELIDHEARTGSNHPLRKKGKQGELALGYGGWIPAARSFGMEGTDDDIRSMILAWRAASPEIEEFWGGQYRKLPGYRWKWEAELYGCEGAVVKTLLTPNARFTVNEFISYKYDTAGDVLLCRLPSGRNLTYHKPRLEPGTDNRCNEPSFNISYWGYNSDTKKGPKGWMKLYTYGGKFAENIAQAIAYDIFVHGMKNVTAAGYPVVLHTHDELTSEVPVGFGSIKEYERLMCELPHWCANWPIRAAGGWRGLRYRK
ncbi:MAG: hypothetical protein GY804_15000, partial [Alphaproteobacteria bacterium]|nr:hypothetical protein [Alphaproteobacteria bacterium]